MKRTDNEAASEPLTIGQVAKRAGIGIETIRFYEREGLIQDPPRSGSGYRLYPLETIDRLLFTRRAKALGFSLKEIRELLSLSVSPDATCEDVRQRAQAKLKAIENKIETLERMKTVLAEIAAACRGKGPASECPILEVMRQGEDLGL